MQNSYKLKKNQDKPGFFYCAVKIYVMRATWSRIFLVSAATSCMSLHSPPHQKKLKEKNATAVGREKK